MSNASKKSSAESFFGEVIATYSRTQALADGVLVDAGPMAAEAGFQWPVALTAAAWADCVAWSDEDNRQQGYQNESGRLWDVLFMASYAIRAQSGSGDRLEFQLYRVPRDGQAVQAVLTTLKLIVGPGDRGEPVVTILLPDED